MNKKFVYREKIINDEIKINFGFKCNNHCIFCYEKFNYGCFQEKTTNEVKKEILAAKKLGKLKLNLLGGEPTIRPDIFCLIEYAKRIGFKSVLITTNGRMFAYLDFAYRIIKSGVSEIVFSLHGHQSKIHDFLTKSPGSFNQLIRGIENLKKLKFNRIGANIVINKKNYIYLSDIAKILYNYQIERAEFIYVIAEDKNLFKKLVPLISKSAPYISKVLSEGNIYGFNWNLLNPPMGCYFSKYFNFNIKYGDSRDDKLLLPTRQGKLYYRLSKKKIINYIKIDKCNECSMRNKCLGIWQSYLKYYGGEEVKPIKII